MSRNPFDDVGKASRGPVPTFQAAASSVDKHIEETVKKAQHDPPQVLPDLITGESYDQLKPRSIELIHQNMLDDARFEHTEYKNLISLPTHQERERAARAMSRRGDDMCKREEDVDWCVQSVERQLHEEQRRTRVTGTCWAIAIFFGLGVLLNDGGVFGALFVGAIMWWVAFLLWYVGYCTLTMGEAPGRAV